MGKLLSDEFVDICKKAGFKPNKRFKETLPADYIVCSSSHISGLIDQVNLFISRGYKVRGQLIVTGGCKPTGFMQPMLKPEEHVWEDIIEEPPLPRDTSGLDTNEYKEMRTKRELYLKAKRKIVPLLVIGMLLSVVALFIYWNYPVNRRSMLLMAAFTGSAFILFIFALGIYIRYYDSVTDEMIN